MGNSRQRFVAGNADARCKRGPAPDEYMDMRYPTRASELVHLRPGHVSSDRHFSDERTDREIGIG